MNSDLFGWHGEHDTQKGNIMCQFLVRYKIIVGKCTMPSTVIFTCEDDMTYEEKLKSVMKFFENMHYDKSTYGDVDGVVCSYDGGDFSVQVDHSFLSMTHEEAWNLIDKHIVEGYPIQKMKNTS